MIRYATLPSPLGPLRLTADDEALHAVEFIDDVQQQTTPPQGRLDSNAVLERAAEQLGEYFDGRRRDFDLPLRPQGTPFQRRVWDALLGIPFGVTVSYGEIAARIGAPNAMRAVGAANGRNPIAVIIPCHRVIGSNGTLTGYGGGLPRKVKLLRLEGAWTQALPLG